MLQVVNEERCNYTIQHKCKSFPATHKLFNIHDTKSMKSGKIDTKIQLAVEDINQMFLFVYFISILAIVGKNARYIERILYIPGGERAS